MLAFANTLSQLAFLHFSFVIVIHSGTQSEKKTSVKVKNSTKSKTSWNSSKVIDTSNITFDLDTRDGILSVINCERFSHFLPFTHYNTTQDTIHAIYCRNGNK